MWTQRLLSALICGSVACSGPEREGGTDTQGRQFVSEATSQCITGHPAGAAPAPGQMSAPPAPAPPTPPTLAEQCRSEGGTGCDEEFISREAARCIAQNDRFEPGLEAWTITLTYHHSYHRVVWGVENLLEERGDGSYSGRSLTIDAVTGEVLGRTGWTATP